MINGSLQREGPVLDAVLARRIARAHGFQRTGSRILARVESIARQRFGNTRRSRRNLLLARRVTGAEVAFRWPADDDSARGVEKSVNRVAVARALGYRRWQVQRGRADCDGAGDWQMMKLRVASQGAVGGGAGTDPELILSRINEALLCWHEEKQVRERFRTGEFPDQAKVNVHSRDSRVVIALFVGRQGLYSINGG